MSNIVDPTPFVQERIAADLAPLREELANATEPRERKRILRAIRRQAKQIRRDVLRFAALVTLD